MNENNNIFPVVAIVPSLNPDEQFLGVVRGLLEIGFTDIIVVDDGSREDCKHFFKEAGELSGVRVLCHEVNKGKGCALKTAFRYYLDNFDREIYCGTVTADADGQHLPEDIMLTCRMLMEKNGAEKKKTDDIMILGTRNFNEKIVPPKSRFGNKTTTLVFKLLYGKWINDTQTGLRAFSNSFTEKCLEIKGSRFEYEINMLIYAVSEKVEMAEQIIKTVYFDSNRETHFRPLADSFKIYRVMFGSFFRFIAASVISLLVDQGLFALLVKLVFAPLGVAATPLSNVIARVVSSVLNFILNKNMVFQKKHGGGSCFWKYLLLWAVQLTASTLGTMGLEALKLDPIVAKIIVDGILFIFSYQIQRVWVFKDTKKKKKEK